MDRGRSTSTRTTSTPGSSTAAGPRPPRLDAFVARVTARRARRPRLRAGLAQRRPRRRRSSRSTPRSRWSSRCASSRPTRCRSSADLERLPFRRGALHGRVGAQVATCTSPAERLPMALAELHRAVALGGAVHLQVTCDQLTRRTPTTPSPAGTSRVARRRGSATSSRAPASRSSSSSTTARSGSTSRRPGPACSPDTVGPDMRVLIVGLNPSVLLGRRGRRLRPARQPLLARRARVRVSSPQRARPVPRRCASTASA